MGVGCALLLIVGTIYSLLYNNGRWVKNMDMSEYVFSYKDIPMLVIGALIALYAIYIVIICFKNVFSKNSREKRYSRTISPYWGFCGMFGFLGFGGFWTYYKFGEIFPFAFFIFLEKRCPFVLFDFGSISYCCALAFCSRCLQRNRVICRHKYAYNKNNA